MRAVIMGGTSGIGPATAEQLTQAGIEVTVTGRDPGRLTAAAARVAAAERLNGTDFPAIAAFFGRFGAFAHLVPHSALGPAAWARSARSPPRT